MSPTVQTAASLKYNIPLHLDCSAPLNALSELKKQSQAMEPHDPQSLTQSLSFIVRPPELMQGLIHLLWHRGNRNSELQFWLEILDGRAWLQTQGGKDWLLTQGGKDWLLAQGGKDWLQTQEGKDWLEAHGGHDWLQTRRGQDWLQTQPGQN
ncbi:hypothetical protein DEU56DRAFT_61609 [Suillus clintonianus]|uniref:uncharacterized protein n=1 Tax=Suillus clintonianus TaxID=1904413 RepID=UPI001B87C36E|nr:uncharacterized protein DEU56DRAFT_61609 [Suillus clintonianus]KAG2149363.1 hypothetical protein DEU56DRAFT_61609 [Suillus clintonianus]